MPDLKKASCHTGATIADGGSQPAFRGPRFFRRGHKIRCFPQSPPAALSRECPAQAGTSGKWERKSPSSGPLTRTQSSKKSGEGKRYWHRSPEPFCPACASRSHCNASHLGWLACLVGKRRAKHVPRRRAVV